MEENNKTVQQLLFAAAAFLFLILLWDMWIKVSHIDKSILPGPIHVFGSMFELLMNGSLVRHTVASLYRVTIGFYAAMILGIPLGIMLGRLEKLRFIVNPVIHFLRPISPLAWIPLAMLWFGIGDSPAIFLIFLSSFFPLAVSTTFAVLSINPVYFQVAANFNFSRRETLTRIVIPAIFPSIIRSLRLTVTISWLVVVAAEMIAVQSGLGYLILDSRNALRMDYVMDGMIIIGLIGLILDMIMTRLGKTEASQWGKLSS